MGGTDERPPRLITAADRAALLIEDHCSVRAAAKALGMDHAHLHKIANGKKKPSKTTLAKLGLMPTPLYMLGKTL